MENNSDYFQMRNNTHNTNNLPTLSSYDSFIFYHLILAILFLIGLSAHNTSHGSSEANIESTYTWDNTITIPTLRSPQSEFNTEQIYLPANIFIPSSPKPEQGYPVLIFINSWAMNESQYKSQAKKFANEGYIVLSYTTRGFRGSPGLIDTAGPKDIADTSSAITWLIDNYPVNTNSIALGGISYGSGIALLTAIQDNRVAAVIAMSTWGSLIESLWGGETPQETWLDILLGAAGWPIGRPNPEMQEMANNMFNYQNITPTLFWANTRSPIHYIKKVNNRERMPAVYVSNNLHDYLFQPNSIIEFLTQYKGPWRLDLNSGIHGTGEASGLLGSNTSYPWVIAKAWLNHYLKGENNNINKRGKVNTVVQSRTREGTPNIRESFLDLPVTDITNDLVFALVPQGDNTGSLSAAPATIMDVEQHINTTKQQVGSGGIFGALQGAGLRVQFDEIDTENALIFTTEILDKTLHLRGSASLTFFAKVEHSSQFFAYLLAYNEATGKAHWIGHAPLTWHLPEGESEVPNNPTELSMNFYWTANDIDKGDRLVLIIDGKDGDYWRYKDTPETNTIVFGNEYPAKLVLPRTLGITPFLPLDDQGNVDSSLGGNGSNAESSAAGGSINWTFSLISLLLLGFRQHFRQQFRQQFRQHLCTISKYWPAITRQYRSDSVNIRYFLK